MGCCVESSPKIWILSIGTVVLITSVIIGLVWPSLSLKLIYQHLVLQNGTDNFKNWVRTPFPMYFEVYMYNMTNYVEWAKDPQKIKPYMQQVGPYVFEEVRERVGIEFDESTVAFNQTRTWYFKQELSGNLSLDDPITNINPISATLNYNLRFMPSWERSLAHSLLDPMGSLLTTKKVRELIFDGYKDNQLDYLSQLKKLIPSIPSLPLGSKFGWFIGRNTSAIHDGRLEMNNGQRNIFKLGIMKRWNGQAHTNYFPSNCGDIVGTTGELWPPMKDTNKPLTMYIIDICRPLALQPEATVTKFGLEGIKWSGDRKMLDGMDDDSSSTCWCLGDKCPDLKPGMFNASTCQFGAPAFMSYPHFYLADSSYLSPIEGMQPNVSEHQFYIKLSPKFGIPLEVRARLQVNMLLRNEPSSKLYKNIPSTFIPMFWFSQVADITEDLAKQAAVMDTVQSSGVWTCYVLGSIGTILLVIGIYLALRPNDTPDGDDVPILNEASSVNVSN